jgi:hypothetical protein
MQIDIYGRFDFIMQSKSIRALSLILYVGGGVAALRSLMLFSSYSTAKILIRRNFFLMEVLSGTAMLLQAEIASSEPSRLRKVTLFSGVFVLLVGVGMGYSWIGGN